MAEQFDVGGVRLERPFKVRRLGHFGLNLTDFEGCLGFYRDDLGFIVSEYGDMRDFAPPGAFDGIADTMFYFLRYGTDHHAMVLASAAAAQRMPQIFGPFNPDVTVNQMTWQVGSLREVVEAVPWLTAQGVKVVRSGRDMPGSNWHAYFPDPDGRVNELYFGMEQVGWDGLSKPKSQYKFARTEAPDLPQPSETQEVDEIRGTPEMWSGHQGRPSGEPRFEVEGVTLPRPFKVVAVGPVKLFCEDLEAALEFYQRILGFTVTSNDTVEGERCIFLRAAADHHNLVLIPSRLRKSLRSDRMDNLCTIGLRVASYSQLRAARRYFAEKGYAEVDMPATLSPGVGHCFHVLDPDGRAFQFYWSMEQIGWDGKPRPTEAALYPSADWPDAIEGGPDLFGGEPFLGPWG